MGDGSGETPGASELRVHGVGGSHGPRMLGFESADDIVVVGEGGGGTSVFARHGDRSVESYDWGDLTSGSGTRALWVLLLPFTLVNVAGWTHPPVDRTSLRKVKWVRRWVHALSALLTATYVITLGTVVVDLVGWRWVRRFSLPTDDARYLAGTLPSTLTAQRVGMFVGLGVLLLVILVVVKVAGNSQYGFEDRAPGAPTGRGLTGREPWGDEERLDGPGFFFHPRSASDRLRAHKVVLYLTWAVVCGWSVFHAYRFSGGPRTRLDVDGLNGYTSVAAVVAILALGAISWRNGRQPGERWVRCAPAIAVILGFAVLNAVSSGTHLLLLTRLNDWPKRPALAAMAAGPEVALADVWAALTLGLVVAAAVFLVARRLTPPADVTPRHSPPGHPLDGADSALRQAIAENRFLARWTHRCGGVALAVAVTLLVTYTGVVGWRGFLHRGGPFATSLPVPTPAQLKGVLFRLGAYVLPFLVLFLVRLVSKSYRGARTIASTLWDVLTFWPRRFSPLAVRPYAERAVPELRGRIAYHVEERGHPLVVSAHSQGSILSFAALAPLPPAALGRVGFVTYGSPVTTIFATFFPAYFGTAEVERLRRQLAVPGGDLLGWRNFYRLTDPIGGPVFLSDTGSADCELPDPFDGSAEGFDSPTTPPLERDLQPWVRIGGHSHYERDPRLKRYVHDLRRGRNWLSSSCRRD